MIDLDRFVRQSADAVVMIRPKSFRLNEETLASNFFQSKELLVGQDEVNVYAEEEFNDCVELLRESGIKVFDYDGTDDSPDEIYPNNWFSTHEDGRVFIYPMCARNRRKERRFDIFSSLAEAGYEVNGVTDLSYWEQEGSFLESTGSMIFDRVCKKIYACDSVRTSKKILDEFAEMIGYEVVFFEAVDGDGRQIYHTNIMMSMGCGFAIICGESIVNSEEKKRVFNSLRDSGREIVDLSLDQVYNYAGNVLQLRNDKGESLLVVSERGERAFTDRQKGVIESYARILPLPINFIETCGGGGVRCMMAEVKLPRKAAGL